MEKATSVTVDGRMVVTFNEVGLAAEVAWLGLVSMTVDAARRGLLVCVLADRWRGEGGDHGGSARARGRIPTLNGASDVKLRFEMKLLQASESCSRSHNDLVCFGKANPRKDASDA